VVESSAFEFELAIEKLKSHKSRGINQIPAQLIKAGGGGGGRKIHYEIHNLLFLFEVRRNCLRSGRRPSFYIPIKRR